MIGISFSHSIEFALNDTYHQSTQSTAFRMNRVTLPQNPFHAVVRNSTADVTFECSTYMGMSKLTGTQTALQAQERFSWARRCVHLAKSKMKESHDKRGTSLHLYGDGDLVWLIVRNVALRHPSMRHKLVPKFLGPMKVLEVVGLTAVKLDLPESLGIHPTVSVSLVKPFMVRPGMTLPPVNIDGELEWERSRTFVSA